MKNIPQFPPSKDDDRLQRRVRWLLAKSKASALLAADRRRRRENWLEAKNRALKVLKRGAPGRQEYATSRPTQNAEVIRKTCYNPPLAEQSADENRFVTLGSVLALATEMGAVTGRMERRINQLSEEIAKR